MVAMHDIVWLYIAIWYVSLSASWQKCHTKRFLELWDNAASHMTFVSMTNRSAGLTAVVRQMLICPFFIMCPDLVLVTSHSCLLRTFLLDVSVPFSLLMPVLLADCSMFSTFSWRDLLFICPLLCSIPVTLFNDCLLLYAAGFFVDVVE